MKTSALTLSIIVAVVMWCSAPVSAEAQNDWQEAFQAALEKGKISPAAPAESGGLAYTPSQETVLEEAVMMALAEEQGDRACECMKMAIDLDYNPYSVLKAIYSVGGDLEIDPLCACATEAGVMKAVIAKAATEAITPLNEPVYNVDEIARSQCLSGLAYTAVDPPTPPPPPPPPPPPSSYIP